MQSRVGLKMSSKMQLRISSGSLRMGHGGSVILRFRMRAKSCGAWPWPVLQGGIGPSDNNTQSSSKVRCSPSISSSTISRSIFVCFKGILLADSVSTRNKLRCPSIRTFHSQCRRFEAFWRSLETRYGHDIQDNILSACRSATRRVETTTGCGVLRALSRCLSGSEKRPPCMLRALKKREGMPKISSSHTS